MGNTTIPYVISASIANRQAMWIFQDIQRARSYYLAQTMPQTSPGFIAARWEFNNNSHIPCGSSSCYFAPGLYAFIAHASIDSPDTIVHELGHHIMHNRTGFWHVETSCFDHEILPQTSTESTSCAWSEGWGDFFALAANGDACYDFLIGPCTGQADLFHYNLENHTRNDSPTQFAWGDVVEGRVAGALYDLMDANNEAPWYDNAAWGFDAIADIAMVGQGQPTLQDFWNAYQGTDKHNGVRSIYQNTIDYDQAPVFSVIPNQRLLHNLPHPHFLDLWNYSSDVESSDALLTYLLVSVSDSRCGVTRDSHWLNATPQTGWVGSCTVTVRASDTLKTTDSSFLLNILPLNHRFYLPMPTVGNP
jgi:hypothetical protein